MAIIVGVAFFELEAGAWRLMADSLPSAGHRDPIVIAKPVSNLGAEPVQARISDVTVEAFRVRLEEWDYLDGTHVDESIGYLALEAGATSLGSLAAEAGSVNINHNWTTVNFTQSFSSAPVVVAQVATFNGSQAVTTRIRNVSASSFQVRLQEEEGNDGPHGARCAYIFLTHELAKIFGNCDRAVVVN